MPGAGRVGRGDIYGPFVGVRGGGVGGGGHWPHVAATANPTALRVGARGIALAAVERLVRALQLFVAAACVSAKNVVR